MMCPASAGWKVLLPEQPSLTVARHYGEIIALCRAHSCRTLHTAHIVAAHYAQPGAVRSVQLGHSLQNPAGGRNGAGALTNQ